MDVEQAARSPSHWAGIRTCRGMFRAGSNGRPLSIAIIAFMIAVPTSGSFGASFDCGLARSDFEHAICNGPQLSAQDDKLNQLYKAIRDSSSDTTELRASQRAWLARARTCTNNDCRIQAYTSRIAELESIAERLQSERTQSEYQSAQASAVSPANGEAVAAPDAAIAEKPMPTPIAPPVRDMGFLRDETGLLSNDQAVVLEHALRQYKARTGGYQFSIVIVKTTNGKAPGEYEAELFKTRNLDQPIPGGLLLLLVTDGRLDGFRVSQDLLNGGFDRHILDNMGTELDKALPDDQSWSDGSRLESALLHVITELTEVVPHHLTAKPLPNGKAVPERAAVAATPDEPFFTPRLIIETSAGCLLLLIGSVFYFHAHKFDKSGREEKTYWVRFFFLYIFWLATGFFWLIIGILKALMSAHSSSRGNENGSATSASRSIGTITKSYRVEELRTGMANFLGESGYLSVSSAVEDAERRRSRDPFLKAVRVVELHNGKAVGTVWSG
jgi:uncharacterized protein